MVAEWGARGLIIDVGAYFFFAPRDRTDPSANHQFNSRSWLIMQRPNAPVPTFGTIKCLNLKIHYIIIEVG